ncbi:Putative doublecortin domain-containing protein ENSP00000382097-like protein [Heterocephalus glaber]|uniref:Putative doublecortin domain-containing protein ENSP00000382097-like protein n=1 Tax=Heterocephalus glaber TaxID=10181 RepID=G5C7L0_HETGA|nr:Putative doublecortin domain-containing protein ENSP00000382097-like protein [Heterocephalus glaber]
MGRRAPRPLVDTTPAKTFLVYRNGDQFYVGRKFMLSRRCVATFEARLEQLTEQVAVPFRVRRLYTPTRGHPVLKLDALRTGAKYKYVAAGRECFRKLDYIHIVPRKLAKMRKLKEAESKESPKCEDIPPETKDSVYYAKEGKKKTLVEPFVPSGAEDDVYKTQTPAKGAQGTLEIKEDPDVKVEVPVDQVPAEVLKELDDAHDNSPKFEGIKVSSSELLSLVQARCLLPVSEQSVQDHGSILAMCPGAVPRIWLPVCRKSGADFSGLYP